MKSGLPRENRLALPIGLYGLDLRFNLLTSSLSVYRRITHLRSWRSAKRAHSTYSPSLGVMLYRNSKRYRKD